MAITIFGRVPPGYPVGAQQRVAAGYMLHELFSWLIVWNAPWFLGQRLIPTIKSYQLSEFLWLKLSPITRTDVLIARLSGLLDFTVITSAQALIIDALMWCTHGLWLSDAIQLPLALLAYQAATFSVTLLLASNVRMRLSNGLLSTVAIALTPFCSYLLYATILYRLGDAYARYHPALFPFVHTLYYTNSLVLALLGLTAFLCCALPGAD